MAFDPVVHLIDDDEGVRQGLAFFLGSAGFAVRVYDSASGLLNALPSLQPGCIITDVRMPGMSGIELLRQLKSRQSRMPVIVMTGHGDIPLAVEAMKAGAVDFIEKPFQEDTMLSAIRLALEHAARSAGEEGEAASILARMKTLTPREAEVLDALVTGLPNKTIAYDLNISARTVEAHRANLMTKMAAGSLPELVRMVFVARAAQ